MRDHRGPADAVPRPYGGGAALVADGEGWVLLDDEPAHGLGGALAWADREGVRLHVLADEDVGVLARRAVAFLPAPTIWRVDGRDLVLAQPTPLPVAPSLPPELGALASVIEAAGAEPVEEHGVLGGEVLGLEVCRAVIGEDGRPRLDVGIGPHDREAFRLVHGDGLDGQALIDALAAVVETVGRNRTPGGPSHPLNRLARERALRHRLVRRPELVGSRALTPAPPPLPRPNLKDPVPCVATGTDADGRTVVVVCSAGIDLDLVPFAADARAAQPERADRLVLAVPEGDDHPVTRRLAARLAIPAELVPVAAP